MQTEHGFDQRIRKTEEKITDLESCLAGNPSSRRWQEINTELERTRLTLKALNDKAANNEPQAYRDFHKKSSGDFQ
jgi:hypothetical protein